MAGGKGHGMLCLQGKAWIMLENRGEKVVFYNEILFKKSYTKFLV